MSAPIGSATTSSTGLAETLDSSRPQLQSRRVSLKLGPLGITYSTDQVLWSAAAGAAATGLAASTLEAGLGAAQTGAAGRAGAEDAAAARQADAQQTAQTEAQQTGRSFSSEMLEAWRRQISERQADSATYGANGTLAGAATRSAGEALPMAEESQDAEQENDQQTGQRQTAQQQAAPASRVRQAIAAYIACAQNYGAVRPMLTAVA
ncbi:hypothetical protein [Humidesulfovibrio idahonensis]